MATIYSKSGTDAAISAATDALTPEDVGADPAGTAAAAIAALGLGTAAQSDATDFAPAASGAYPVQQVTLTGSLAYALPVDAPADQVISVVFTQDGTGGHTVTYGGSTIPLRTDGPTIVEFYPLGGGSWRAYSDAGTTTTTTPGAPTNLRSTTTSTSAIVSWDAVNAATGYVLRLDGGVWQDLGTVTSWTGSGFAQGSEHTVNVAAYIAAGVYGAAASHTFATTVGQAAITELFDAPDGTAITALSSGVAWLAPGNETAVTGSVGTLQGRQLALPQGGTGYTGGKVSYAGDVRMTVNYRGYGGGTIRLHHGGSSVNVTLTAAGTVSSTVKIVNDKPPVVTLVNGVTGAQDGTLAIDLIGTAVTVWHNGTQIGSWTAGTATATHCGFVLSGLCTVAAFRVEPVTVSSPAPTAIIKTTKAAGTLLSGDDFTGADATNLLARTGTGAGASPSWYGEANAATILNNAADRGAITGYSNGLIRVGWSDHSVSCALTKVPTAGELRLQARRTYLAASEAYHMKVTPTAIQPCKEGGTTLGTSFGTPQVGDVYTVTVKGTSITFSAKRADGTAIGDQTFTDTARAVGYFAGVHAPANSAGWAIDNFTVKAA